MRKKILMLAAFTFLGTTTLLAMGRRLEGALNPTLLWEKEFPGSIIIDRNMKLARITGDVMVTVYPETREAEEIAGVYLFDKNGNEAHHWKKGFGTISDNGEKILFTSGPSGVPVHNKVHYCTRDGQELWNGRIGGEVYISPDGSLVVDASRAMDPSHLIEVYDATGKKIWSYKVAESLRVAFSPDSNYIGVSGGSAYSPVNKIRIYHRDGSILWAKERSDMGISCISEEATFISTVKFICDKAGNIISGGDWVDVVDSGKVFVSLSTGSVVVGTLPDKSVLRDYPIRNLWFDTHKVSRSIISASYNGRYLALFGERTDVVSPNNLFVLDTETDQIWETKIEPAGKSESRLMQVLLTKDGKYMLVQAEGKLYYYQIY